MNHMLPPAYCKDCGVDLHDIGEYCMLINQTWFDAARKNGAHVSTLCIGCIEHRLERRLTPADFDNTYQQNSKPGKSDRMRQRMGVV